MLHGTQLNRELNAFEATPCSAVLLFQFHAEQLLEAEIVDPNGGLMAFNVSQCVDVERQSHTQRWEWTSSTDRRHKSCSVVLLVSKPKAMPTARRCKLSCGCVSVRRS